MDNLETLKNKINAKLENASYFYISSSIERSIGLENILSNFHAVCIDQSQINDLLKNKGISIFCLKDVFTGDIHKSAFRILEREEFKTFFDKNKKEINYFQTFKISAQFEALAGSMGVNVLNTSSLLNLKFEDKISQFKEISQLNVSLPKTIIGTFSELNYSSLVEQLGNIIVIQFNKGHTGSGTKFISNEEEYKQLATKFPNRTVKFSEKAIGNTYTLNACVSKQGIFMGGLSRQITGIPSLTADLGATVGNDWAYHTDFKNGKEKLIADVKTIGEYMRSTGYLGLFGIDVIVDNAGHHKIIEINARQAASIPMYTKIQIKNGQIPLALIHIAEFLNIEYSINVNEYNSINLMPVEYSQVFVRAFKDEKINGELRLGFYQLKGDKVVHNEQIQNEKEYAIFLDEERDKSLVLSGVGYDITDPAFTGLLLLPMNVGTIIKKNEEIARIQLNQGAYLDNNLKPWIIESMKAIKDYLI